MTVVLTSTKGLMDGTHGHALLNSLNEQRTKGLFCDVTIVVEDIKFKAHKNVLAACSGYFRNAFSSTEVWTSGQVLELLDLRSEVFASILNFIYSSKVAPAGTEDVRLLVAAGKKLGIPFLEKLVEREKRCAIVPQGLALSDRVKAASPRHTPLSLGPQPLKRETPRPEYTDCASGPRITNAFSITEAGAGNNPFTPLDLRNDGQPSPEPVQLLTPNSTPAPSEPVHTLSEHSYAVSQTHKGTEHTEDNQADGIKNIQPTHVPPRQQASLNSGPLKKRHRLSGTNFESIPDTFAIPMQRKISCTTPLSATATPETLSTLPNLNDPVTTETEQPVSENASTKESDSPPLVFRCEYCPETFGNRATLNRHTQTHKKRFVSHLFCKFCRRKFMHLKRLRNHEQVCSKALRSTSQQDLTCTEASIALAPDNLSNTDDRTLLWQSPSLPDIPNNPSTQTDSPEIQQEAERGVRMVEGQRLYKCSMCKRAYVTLSSLRRHENVHSWQRAYPCHYCNKVFALAEYRTKHEIWHTGERRYQCIFCLETFMTYYILKNHQKSFHGIDPRLVVKKKSANGGFKGSVYPIKLYRLLPMKFRKRQYKTYSQTFSEPLDCNSQNLPLPLSCSSPSTGFEENVTLDNTDGVSVGQSLFSMPVTFMATPKVVASVTPRVNFDQPCDKDVAQPLSSEAVCPQRTRTSASSETDLCTTRSNAGTRGSSVISYRYTPPTVPMQPSRVSSVIVHGNNMASGSHNKTLSDNPGLPFMETNNANSSEPTERLVDFPAASHIMEDIADHLSPEESFRAKTETYIAKPACPGPSMDSHVLPLCQITVKIGDEAIVRRRIKGSKLFPRKRKRSHWSQIEEGRGIDKFPSLRLRTEVTSVKEAEPLDDATERDTADQLWRPYYSYKPKKKAKKLRAKQRKGSQSRLPGRPTKDAIRAPGFKVVEDYQETGYGPKEKIPSDTEPIRRHLKKNSQKTTYTCDICKSPFYSLSTLRTHVISCRSYLCGTCGKPCSPEEAPGLKSPAEGRDLICKRCVEDGSCFENTRNPNKEKRYRCSFCPQRFLYLATKKSHEKKHIEKHGKGYSCYYCPKVCKTSMSLSVHQKKHLIKTEEAEVDRKQPAGSLPSLSEGMEGTKPEAWAISEVDMSLTPKLEDQVEINSIGHYQQFKQSKVKTLMSPCESSLLVLPTEVPQGKPWKSHGVDPKHLASQCGDNKCQGSVDGQAFSNKELPPTPGMNSHCNTGQFSLSHMKTDPVHYSTDSSFPKSELMNSCKEEPSFHTLH